MKNWLTGTGRKRRDADSQKTEVGSGTRKRCMNRSNEVSIYIPGFVQILSYIGVLSTVRKDVAKI
jgi:hypothetical protein